MFEQTPLQEYDANLMGSSTSHSLSVINVEEHSEIKEQERRRIVGDLISEKYGDKAMRLLGACRLFRLILWAVFLGSGIMLIPMKKQLYEQWLQVVWVTSTLVLLTPMNILFTLTLDQKVLSLILMQFRTWVYFGFIIMACAVYYVIHSDPENNGVLGYWWLLLGVDSIYFILLMVAIDAQTLLPHCEKAFCLFLVFTYCVIEYLMLRQNSYYDDLNATVLDFRLLDITLAICLHIGIYCLGCLWRLALTPDKMCGVLVSPTLVSIV